MIKELLDGDVTATDVIGDKVIRPGATHDLPLILCVLFIIIVALVVIIIIYAYIHRRPLFM
jgi:hypothetical protein